MTEVTEEESRQVLPEGAIGRLEPVPDNPEIKKAEIKVILSPDGFFFTNLENAIKHKEAFEDASKPPGM